MRFQVPQFIDIEDKIVGPLTLKQFIYIAGNAALAFVSYRMIPITIIGIVLAIFFLSFGGLLAFYQYNNRPLINLVSAAFAFYTKPQLYIWKPHQKETKENALDISHFKTTARVVTPTAPAPSASKLTDMSWQLDM